MVNQIYRRGNLYYADLGWGLGSEQRGTRPVVIIQNDVGNRHSPTVIVAAISGRVGIKAKLPTHYCMEAGRGLVQPSVVLLEQIRTIDKRRLSNYIGKLDEQHIHGVDRALAISIGLIGSKTNKAPLCLCNACAENFRSTGAFRLYPTETYEDGAAMCAYCGQYLGINYEVITK